MRQAYQHSPGQAQRQVVLDSMTEEEEGGGGGEDDDVNVTFLLVLRRNGE